jgi:hypothetical protein
MGTKWFTGGIVAAPRGRIQFDFIHVGSEKFYARLGWRVLRRAEEKIVMSKPTAG